MILCMKHLASWSNQHEIVCIYINTCFSHLAVRRNLKLKIEFATKGRRNLKMGMTAFWESWWPHLERRLQCGFLDKRTNFSFGVYIYIYIRDWIFILETDYAFEPFTNFCKFLFLYPEGAECDIKCHSCCSLVREH